VLKMTSDSTITWPAWRSSAVNARQPLKLPHRPLEPQESVLTPSVEKPAPVVPA
jgi:hypothetical protein